MAFPKLLQKLFQNNGAGDKLNQDIIPDIPYSKVTGAQVGDIKLYAGSNVPDGWFRCDGSTIADMATNYPKLYAVLGTNVLPNYSGRVPLGASSDINTAVEAGLPNLEGTFAPRAGVGFMEDGTYTGVFAAEDIFGTAVIAYIEEAHNRVKLVFNASKCSSIYGKSTTVQPPSIKCAFLIKHD